MVIGIFGESCTGKSTLADELSIKLNARVYTGKDYTKIAKNESEAKKQFIEMLKSAESTDEKIIYVISEREDMSLLPEKSVRVLVTAELDIIKERFSKRMNGNLPAPVATMLEKKHGSFDNEKYDIRIENSDADISDSCIRIMALCRK